jgi:hypothetical protein
VTYQLKGVIPMAQNGVISIEEEITNTKRQIDDIEWEGGHCDHLHKHLEHLIHEYLNGSVYYAPF